MKPIDYILAGASALMLIGTIIFIWVKSPKQDGRDVD